MILSGNEIKKQVDERNILISPWNEEQLNPNSYNIKLHDELLVYNDIVLDMSKNNGYRKIEIPETGLKLSPGVVYLGRSVEYTKTVGFVPMLEGRSSVGRLGLLVHVTAGFGDSGFAGYWTLELVATQPIIIFPFVNIAQIFYHTIEGEQTFYSEGKYQNNTGIQSSKLFTEF